MAGAEITRAWLHEVYASCPGWLAIFTLPDRHSVFITTDRLDEAADLIIALADTQDVYVGCCTLDRRPGGGRGGAADTLAMPGLWVDLDLAGPAHKSKTLPLPADGPAALAILADLDLPPSAVIDSGHGLQVWWFFDRPLVFDFDFQRRVAANLSSRWGSTLVELGRRRGWHVDDTSDLARIMRPAGTINRKATPMPVRMLGYDGARRYQPDELSARCIELPAPAPKAQTLQPPQVGGESPAQAFSRLVSWPQILEPAGFVLMAERGETAYWRHPAATSPAGTPSATTDHNGVPVMVVFSESAAAVTGLPCGPGRRLTRFRAWAHLYYGGNESEAAKAILQMARGAQ